MTTGYSGPVPDPAQILCAMIADLRRPNGVLNVPGLYAKVARPSAKQLARIRQLNHVRCSLQGPDQGGERDPRFSEGKVPESGLLSTKKPCATIER